MKKSIFIAFITLVLTQAKTFSQTINLSPDTIRTLLCKKWKLGYAMAGNEIERPSSTEEIGYEFNKDGTFLVIDKDIKGKLKGTWKYDSKKKTIKLTAKGQSFGSIISLKDGELSMQFDDGPWLNAPDAPKAPSKITLVFQIKT